jgi:hypothetical protein
MANPHFEATKRQKQIIMGTILGGSSIIAPKNGKHCYLSMRDKNGKWLDYKSQELKSLASVLPMTLEKTNRWHSCCHPVFDEMKTLFYNKKKERHLTIDTLSILWDIGFAIWFGDTAKMIANGITINTHVWGEKGTNTIIEYFKVLDCPAKTFKDRKSFRVRLEKDSAIKILTHIEHEIPMFMLPLGLKNKTT